ncbi:MAG: hypothetical protein ACFFDT_27745 [Candidatus Hodarchaeota archaeon]
MYSNEISDEARKWMIWFLLKANLIIIGLFILFNGLINEDILIVLIALVLLLIGGILVYLDIQNDPYQMLKLLKIQTLLWWRLRGPLISRKPFYYHFPEGSQLQQPHLVRSVSVQQKDLIQGLRMLTTVKIAQLCSECSGKRSKPMTVQIECSYCQNGRQIHSLGAMNIPIPCNHCLGIGWVPIHPCPVCRGEGSVWRKQTIRVQIPPNSSVGTKLRIPTLGKVNPKTLQQGDLFLKIRKNLFNLF